MKNKDENEDNDQDENKDKDKEENEDDSKDEKSLPPDSTVPRRPDADRRVRQADRIARVLRVLELIQSRGRWTRKAIAEELEVSIRTVYRDLDVLRFLGVPYYAAL